LRVELRASPTLAATLAGAHAAAAAAVAASAPGLTWIVLAATALATSACWTIRRHALLRDHRSVIALELRGECECNAMRRDGSSAAWRIEGSSYVSARLIVLHLREQERRGCRRITLVPDSVGAERFRRLCVRLRWCRTDGEGDAASASL
jgi:hypothetical protein